ncbi:hypothetical protein V6N13_033833 [Hibiscus sabdariffa]
MMRIYLCISCDLFRKSSPPIPLRNPPARDSQHKESKKSLQVAKDEEIRVTQEFYESKKSYTGMHMYKEAYQCLHNLVTATKTVIVFSITSGANVSFFLNACLWAFSGSFMETKQPIRAKVLGSFISGLKVKPVLAGFLQTTYQISTFAHTGNFISAKLP